MDREILFRGQTRKYGEKVAVGTREKLPGQWVYGGVFPGSGDFSIIYGWEAEEEWTGRNIKKWTVYSDTVVQYTGLTDKNGVKIFEGDILHVQEPEDPCGKIPPVYGVVKFGTYAGGNSEHIGFYVEWKDNEYGDYHEAYRNDLGYWHKCPHCAVCGNIHDNPELLEEV